MISQSDHCAGRTRLTYKPSSATARAIYQPGAKEANAARSFKDTLYMLVSSRTATATGFKVIVDKSNVHELKKKKVSL